MKSYYNSWLIDIKKCEDKTGPGKDEDTWGMNAGMLPKCVALVNFRLSVDSQTHAYPWDPDEHCIFLYGTKKTVKTINLFFKKD